MHTQRNETKKSARIYKVLSIYQTKQSFSHIVSIQAIRYVLFFICVSFSIACSNLFILHRKLNFFLSIPLSQRNFFYSVQSLVFFLIFCVYLKSIGFPTNIKLHFHIAFFYIIMWLVFLWPRFIMLYIVDAFVSLCSMYFAK